MSLVIWFIVAGCIAVIAILVIIWSVRSWGARGERRVSAYVDALHRLLDGDEKMAMERLKVAVQQEPNNVDAYLRLGDLLRSRGHLERALQLHHHLTVRRGLPPSQERAIWRSVARDYIGLNRPQKAIAVLTELTSRFDRDDIEAHEMLLGLYEGERRWDEAFREQQKILQAKRQKSPHRLALYHAYVAREELADENLEAAERNCKKALRIDRRCVSALLCLGDVQYRQGEVKEAVRTWCRIVKEVPELAHVTFRRLEQAYFERGKFGEIIEVYDALLAKDSRNVRALLAKAKIHERKGEEEEAFEALRRVLEIEPNSRAALVALLELYIKVGDIRAAVTQAHSLVELLHAQADSFRCSSCGYRTTEALWRCPNCRQWETFFSPSP
ncbi:hypothetical protein AMJ39_06130 [candidate division TA06 bacterium DG_24]|uniref:LapB rubredoxin metal binding domain-containing protein n=3 Tax=Bacteria division TA06 TaxID=1156500 RepID=A0A0S8JAH1_UNCT6|nr:MAG: hypothetical protein AMJ39_06130 [candidate division TA06 bacterium DG_24]KPK70405.1 MAG: hypothetical protein AMJ82_03335 [candidate division TA06 bacterium SM23_40]KPL06761.1 MAG: hypothetical protein AMJ71_09375 [candidate division TA06 bacterium SM1_40]